MKTLYTTFFLLICFQTISFGQNYRISTSYSDQETGEYCYYISGDHSSLFMNSMFQKYPETERNPYTNIFKDVTVNGISETLGLTVRNGIYHYSCTSSGGCCSSISVSYFNPFLNKKGENKLTSAMTQSDSFAVAIYVTKADAKGGLTTQEESSFFIEYLKMVIGPLPTL